MGEYKALGSPGKWWQYSVTIPYTPAFAAVAEQLTRRINALVQDVCNDARVDSFVAQDSTRTQTYVNAELHTRDPEA